MVRFILQRPAFSSLLRTQDRAVSMDTPGMSFAVPDSRSSSANGESDAQHSQAVKSLSTVVDQSLLHTFSQRRAQILSDINQKLRFGYIIKLPNGEEEARAIDRLKSPPYQKTLDHMLQRIDPSVFARQSAINEIIDGTKGHEV
jgi:hypothetical protein